VLKVLRVSHSACLPAHRARDRALAAEGIELTLALPERWSELATDSGGSDPEDDAVELRRMAVRRSGDVNRHRYVDEAALDTLMCDVRPDLLDIHEEPFSVAARQWIAAARRHDVPVVLYTAQNIDKRFPPPFAQYERSALASVIGVYPCSRQAASVVRGKGFGGRIEVLPLGYDPGVFSVGDQSLDDDEILFGLVGRMVPEKGVVDAVRVLSAVHAVRPARLVLIGSGPELERCRRTAAELGLGERVEVVPWTDPAGLADWYRRMHVVLVPSTTTSRWVEQFGRVIVEGQASGAVTAGYASGSIPEVAGDAGVLVPEGKVDALADAVLSLVTVEDHYRRRQARGLEAARRMSWRAVAERQISFYEKAFADHMAREHTLPRYSRPGRGTRASARLEFGPTAAVFGQERPFALPVLRSSPVVGGALGRVFDVVNA